jgi:hypothetical protein
MEFGIARQKSSFVVVLWFYLLLKKYYYKTRGPNNSHFEKNFFQKKIGIVE